MRTRLASDRKFSEGDSGAVRARLGRRAPLAPRECHTVRTAPCFACLGSSATSKRRADAPPTGLPVEISCTVAGGGCLSNALAKVRRWVGVRSGTFLSAGHPVRPGRPCARRKTFNSRSEPPASGARLLGRITAWAGHVTAWHADLPHPPHHMHGDFSARGWRLAQAACVRA